MRNGNYCDCNRKNAMKFGGFKKKLYLCNVPSGSSMPFSQILTFGNRGFQIWHGHIFIALCVSETIQLSVGIWARRTPMPHSKPSLPTTIKSLCKPLPKLAATNCEFFCVSISKITFSALSRSKICPCQKFLLPLHPNWVHQTRTGHNLWPVIN